MVLAEFEMIAKHFAPMAAPGALGLLDDAAILTPPAGHDLVVTKDMLVAGVHFFPEDPAGLIAAKALRVNLSDLAAKGAEPLGFLLGLAIPDGLGDDWLAAFAAGLASNSTAYGIPLFGGDTVRMPGPLTVSITAFGSVPAGTMVKRNAVRPHDHLFVTSVIGDAALGLKLRQNPEAPWAKALSPKSRHWLLDLYLLPWPRNRIAPQLRAFANAAMDISDGFIGDLTKMLAGSGLGGIISLDAVPFSPAVQDAIALEPPLRDTALTGGDDYELLIAVGPDRADGFLAAMADNDMPITCIGEAQEGALRFLEADGAARSFAHGSFVHF
jgi:thiamine-monophosphate kinase